MLRLRTPAKIFVKYGPCSRRRLAPVARLQDKVVRMSLCIRVEVCIELLYGPLQHNIITKSWGFGTARRRFAEICHITHTYTKKVGMLIHTKLPQIFQHALLLRSHDKKTPWFRVVPIKALGF